VLRTIDIRAVLDGARELRERLTARQREVLTLVARGATNAQIAAQWRTPRNACRAAVVALVLALSASALAAQPGTYTGTLAPPRSIISVSLTVHAGRLSKTTLSNLPLYCSGGGPPIPFTFKGTSISKSGAFKVRGVNRIKIGPLKGQIGEKLTLTGRFTGHGRVSGKLATVYPRAKTCGGTSRFSARR
jgi:hypothetical protein